MAYGEFEVAKRAKVEPFDNDMMQESNMTHNTNAGLEHGIISDEEEAVSPNRSGAGRSRSSSLSEVEGKFLFSDDDSDLELCNVPGRYNFFLKGDILRVQLTRVFFVNCS